MGSLRPKAFLALRGQSTACNDVPFCVLWYTHVSKYLWTDPTAAHPLLHSWLMGMEHVRELLSCMDQLSCNQHSEQNDDGGDGCHALSICVVKAHLPFALNTAENTPVVCDTRNHVQEVATCMPPIMVDLLSSDCGNKQFTLTRHQVHTSRHFLTEAHSLLETFLFPFLDGLPKLGSCNKLEDLRESRNHTPIIGSRPCAATYIPTSNVQPLVVATPTTLSLLQAIHLDLYTLLLDQKPVPPFLLPFLCVQYKGSSRA